MTPELIAAYAELGGPLPRGMTGSTAAAFWRGYTAPAERRGLCGGAKGSVADRAWRAGIARQKVEPGLTVADARMRFMPSVNVRTLKATIWAIEAAIGSARAADAAHLQRLLPRLKAELDGKEPGK